LYFAATDRIKEGASDTYLDSDAAFSPPTLADLGQIHADASFDATALSFQVVAFVALLLLSAFFSGSEVALFSMKGSAKAQMAEAQDRASRRVMQLLSTPRPVLVTILILNTTVNVMAAIIAAVATTQLAAQFQWSTTITVLGEVVVVTIVLLILSEITPKLIAARDPAKFSRRVSWVLLALHRLLSPMSKALAGMTQHVHGRFVQTRLPISADELKTMAEIGEAHGTIEEQERELIHSIVDFGETSVREIMVSRLDVVALPVTSTLAEALDLIRESGHSRMPLFVDHLDNILGIVHAKDLLPYLSDTVETRRMDWTRIARKPMFVPAGRKVDDLLKDFQTRKTHIAIVVDEYGGTAGLVTLEDVLEEVVGEIRDEHDESEEELYQRMRDGSYLCDGRMNLDDLNELLGTEMETDNLDFETLGGLVFHLSGRVPRAGDRFTFENLELSVRSVVKRRVQDVVVRTVHTTNQEP
jgi:gliding motility-associated protein GldE